jgi:sec-independent protein translocase protein TatA
MKTLLLFRNFGIWEILIIALIILLIFGGKKIPELMKGIGKGIKSLKEGLSDADKDIDYIKDELRSKPKEKSKPEEPEDQSK